MSESSTSAPATEPAPASAAPQKSREERRTERHYVEIARLDLILAFLVPILTFALASFVVRNSDYWLHLATGRAIAKGEYSFGADPFAYTTGHVYWVNHSWLYDWLLYLITNQAGGQTAGGAIIAVVLKALAMALLAVILLQLRRRGQGWYAPAVSVGLAMLAMAPGMSLEPAAVSLLFLGLTLLFIVRDGKPDPANLKGVRLLLTTSPNRLYVLPVLFMLWANLDGWFFLGPLTVGLYLLGEKLQQALSPDLTGPDAPLPGEQRALAVVLVGGLGACLISPHHIHVFSNLPPELFASSRFWELRDDPRFAELFVTPFSSVYFTPAYGLNVCGMAYFPLLIGGVVSFILTRSHWRVWRLLIWTAFAGLSVTSAAMIPLFAVVAGPIMALNFQDFAAPPSRETTPVARRHFRLALAIRLVTLLLAVILLAGAWPGWLQAHAGNSSLARRVGWGVEVNPSLYNAAAKLEFWRMNGLLSADEHGFNFSPDAAHYFAWFCPSEKGFLDSRIGLFTGNAGSYVDIRQMLVGSGRHAPGAVPDWQEKFRRHGITHVVLSGTDERTEVIVARLLRDPQWTLLYLDGWTSIFGWDDPRKKTANGFASLRLDRSADAFGPKPTQAPRQGAGRPPEPRSWFDRYMEAPPPPSLDTADAEMLLVYFQHGGDRRFPMAAAVGLFGSTGPPKGPLPSFASMIYYRSLAPIVTDSGPPAALPLAVRAARRAIAVNPDGPETYLALARATEHLWLAQENHWCGSRIPDGPTPGQLAALIRAKKPVPPAPWLVQSLNFRHVLRRVQELTALNQYLAVKPDNPIVHHYLFRIYWSMNYYDAAVDHLREQARLMRAASGRAKNPTEADKAITEVEAALAEYEKQLKELQREYEIAAAGKPPRVQAMGAFRPFGLPRQALAALLREDLTTLNGDEASLVIYLHLTLGQADRLRGQFTEQQKAMIGPANFELLRVLASAAVGDYADADSHLASAMESLPSPTGIPLLHMLQASTFGQLQPALLNRQLLVPFLHDQRVVGARQAAMAMQQLDELRVTRGLLALEVGDVDKAAEYFRQALAVPDPRYAFESRGLATRYLFLLSAAHP